MDGLYEDLAYEWEKRHENASGQRGSRWRDLYLASPRLDIWPSTNEVFHEISNLIFLFVILQHLFWVVEE